MSAPIDDDEDEDEDEETLHVEAKPIKVAAPTVPSATRRTWIVWLEVLAVLALTNAFYGGHSPAGLVIRTLGLHSSATNFYLPSILHDAFDVFVILAAIHLSGDRWAAFGITKPTAIDLFTASIVCIVAIGVTTVGISIFIDILKSMYSERDFYRLIHQSRPLYNAHGWSGLVALLLLAISTGFTEELFGRGYLIPRLERLLESTWASVIASAGVFGVLHWQSGILSMCSAFLGGLVYGIAFAWSRRIWPVAIAHAAHDFSLFLSHAG